MHLQLKVCQYQKNKIKNIGLLNKYMPMRTASVWDDIKVLEMGSGDGCITV